jgi:predicted nuclease with TOPRIM domain
MPAALQELKHIKAHTQIWQDESSSQVQKLQAESDLLQQQLEEAIGKLAAANSRLVELRAERDSALQVGQQKGVGCLLKGVGCMGGRQQGSLW